MDTPADPFASLAEDTLRLEQTGPTSFQSTHTHDNSQGAIFGGQFLAQALLAAQATVAGQWPAHSASAYFMRPGGMDAPVEYEVECVRDGRAFANRRVVARQKGKALFDMICSFHEPESGPSHQSRLPEGLPGPDDLPDLADYLRANADRIPAEDVASYLQPIPVQFRLIDPETTFHLNGKPATSRSFWMRFPSGERVSELRRHQPLIAYVSDFWLGPVANELHHPPFPKRWPVHTVSHTMTFHGLARTDEWMLYLVESPWAGEGLGFTRGLLFDRAGKLLVTTTQEVIMRHG